MKSTKKLRNLFVQRNNVLVLLILLVVSLIFPILILNRIRFYKLPVGGDAGIWLELSFAIFENNYPVWNSSQFLWGTPFQHGPIPFLVLYPLAKIMGEVLAANTMGIVFMALRPIAVFFFAKKLLRNQYFALLCSTVDAFFPSYYEMYGFGGYPNLLAFILLPLAFAYVLQASTRINLIVASILSIIIVWSHHLTSIIFLIIIFFWMLSKFVLDKQYKFPSIIMLVTFLSFLILQFLGGESYVFFNELAYYGLVITVPRIVYVFKNLIVLALLVVSAFIGMIELSKKDRQGTILLLSWLTSPLLFYVVTYYTKFLIVDYTRLLFYLVQPLIIGSVYFLQNLWQRKKNLVISKTVVTSYQFIAISLACLLVLTTFNFGFVTMNNVISYNKSVLESKFSDQNSYDMLMWIKQNLEENVTIVTRAQIIPRYIEGIDHKRVLNGAPNPKYAFKKGDYDRILAGRAILTCNIIGCSDMFTIKDQTPVLFSRTPCVYVFSGAGYELLGYFADNYPWELHKLTMNITEMNVGSDFYEIKYVGPNQNVETIKTVTLKSDEVDVTYEILGKDKAKLIVNMTLFNYFWFDWGKNWDFINGTLVTDYGNIEVVTNAISVEKEYVSQYKQWRLVFSFDDELSVTFKMKDTRMVKGNTVLTTSDESIKQYGVTHALVRVDDTEAMKWIQNTGNWRLIYNNTLFYLYSLDKNNH